MESLVELELLFSFVIHSLILVFKRLMFSPSAHSLEGLMGKGGVSPN